MRLGVVIALAAILAVAAVAVWAWLPAAAVPSWMQP